MTVRSFLPRLAVLAVVLLAAGCAFTGTTPTPVTPQGAGASPRAAAPTLPSPTAIDSPNSTQVPTAAADAPTPVPAKANAVEGQDWTMYHRDNARTGYLPDTPDPSKLTQAWNTPLDGAVYAEPLVVGGHVLVATESNTIYSLNAQTGVVEWKTNLGTPVSRGELPCGNIDPLGITGTPIYDPASGLVFALAEISGPSHILAGIDVKAGEVKVRRPVDTAGMDPQVHQQRAALALAGGMVYIAFGGLFGDCGNYRGTVIASRTDGTGPLLSFTVPTPREGGIWAPPGPVIDGSGKIHVSVGNGGETLSDWDKSDSVLRLSPQLQLEDGFAPNQWRQDNLFDADLGSLGPVLLPGNLIFIAGKAGIGYLIHADRMGGVGGQAVEKQVCHAYGGAAVAGSTVLLPCNEGVQQVKVGPGPDFTLGWRADGVPGSPVIGGHTVYALDEAGSLRALDLDTGAERASADVGPTTRFATPTLYGRRLFIGTTSGIVAVDGS